MVSKVVKRAKTIQYIIHFRYPYIYIFFRRHQSHVPPAEFNSSHDASIVELQRGLCILLTKASWLGTMSQIVRMVYMGGKWDDEKKRSVKSWVRRRRLDGVSARVLPASVTFLMRSLPRRSRHRLLPSDCKTARAGTWRREAFIRVLIICSRLYCAWMDLALRAMEVSRSRKMLHLAGVGKSSDVCRPHGRSANKVLSED